MLHLYIYGIDKIPPELEVIEDIETGFNLHEIKDTSETRKLLSLTEKGQWINTESFIDRFGYKLWLDSLSTGCKAALLAASHPDKVINLRECGYNARDAIILNIREGQLLVYWDDVIISQNKLQFDNNGIMKDTKIEIENGGKVFKSLDKLNEYLLYEKMPM